MVRRCPKATSKPPRPIIRRRTTKKAANTRNLVNQLKPILKTLSSQIPDFPNALRLRLMKEVNIDIIKSSLQNQDLNCLIKQKISSGELFKMVYQSRKQSNSFGNVLKYYNKIINAVYNPNIVVGGFWTLEIPLETKLEEKQCVKEEVNMKTEGESTNTGTKTEGTESSDQEQGEKDDDNEEKDNNSVDMNKDGLETIQTAEELKQAGVY